MNKTEQWYDNTKGQLGTLGANGGYDKSQEYNRDKNDSFTYMAQSISVHLDLQYCKYYKQKL